MAAASAVACAWRDSDNIMPSSSTIEITTHRATMSRATNGATAPLRRVSRFNVMAYNSWGKFKILQFPLFSEAFTHPAFNS
jgi:hypothetical protein